jgi:hypothetical protein
MKLWNKLKTYFGFDKGVSRDEIKEAVKPKDEPVKINPATKLPDRKKK